MADLGAGLTLATYPGARWSARGQRVEATWEELRAWLRDFSRHAPEKRAAPCWAPHTLADGRRRLDSCVEVCALVVDYDRGMTPRMAVDRWHGWEVAAHATWTSTREAPRARAVLPLRAPVAASAWSAVYRVLLTTPLMADADPACSDPTRLSLLPAMGPRELETDPWGGDLRWASGRGEWLDLTSALEVAADREADARRQAQAARAHRRATDTGRPRVDAPAARLALGLRLGGRHYSDRIRGVTCPACSRRSVWWWLDPTRARRAMCGHRDSCGWSAHLDEL